MPPRGHPLPALTAHAHQGGVGFIAFVLNGLLRRSGNSLLISILGQIAVAANYFFPIYNSNEPLGLACIPGNFHLIRTHICLLCAPFLYHSSSLSRTATPPFGRPISLVR